MKNIKKYIYYLEQLTHKSVLLIEKNISNKEVIKEMSKSEAKYLKDKVNKSFWVDPMGRIHKWKGDLGDVANMPSIHYAIAHSIKPEAKYPEDFLSSMGWILVGTNNGGRRKCNANI